MTHCPENDSRPKLLGTTEPDPMSTILGAGYMRFSSPVGIDGLAKSTEDRLDLLAVFARNEGRGQFREFIRQAKEQFTIIGVWVVWNSKLADALTRYGFTPETEIQGNGDVVTGFRWDKYEKGYLSEAMAV